MKKILNYFKVLDATVIEKTIITLCLSVIILKILMMYSPFL